MNFLRFPTRLSSHPSRSGLSRRRGCKAVPLTVVHTNGLLYYRGHPHEEHGEGCMYTLKEIVIKDVEKIGGDIEKQAVSQLDMLLRSMVDNNQKPDTTKTGNSGQDCRDIPVVHRQQTLQKRLPPAQQPLHIAFLGSPSSLQTQKLKLSHMCYLRRSTFLQILEGWIA